MKLAVETLTGIIPGACSAYRSNHGKNESLTLIRLRKNGNKQTNKRNKKENKKKTKKKLSPMACMRHRKTFRSKHIYA